jgi:hypothetical protein
MKHQCYTVDLVTCKPASAGPKIHSSAEYGATYGSSSRAGLSCRNSEESVKCLPDTGLKKGGSKSQVREEDILCISIPPTNISLLDHAVKTFSFYFQLAHILKLDATFLFLDNCCEPRA